MDPPSVSASAAGPSSGPEAFLLGGSNPAEERGRFYTEELVKKNAQLLYNNDEECMRFAVLRLAKQQQTFAANLCDQMDYIACAFLLVIYFYDLSLLRLLLRFIPLVGLRVTVLSIRKPPPINKGAIVTAVVLSSVLSVVWHSVNGPPVAKPGDHNYLYGGLTLELIGQLATSSTVKLIAMDIVVLLLQLGLVSHRFLAATNEFMDPMARTIIQDLNALRRSKPHSHISSALRTAGDSGLVVNNSHYMAIRLLIEGDGTSGAVYSGTLALLDPFKWMLTYLWRILTFFCSRIRSPSSLNVRETGNPSTQSGSNPQPTQADDSLLHRILTSSV